jgi:G6PDH family F420-dependent oxidoreductase
MPKIGYFLSSEEHPPQALIEQARLAEEAGFEALWIADHYHPWNDEQGHSPFVWTVIGGIAQVCRLPVTTAVTCPTVRIHPAVVAQAAATCATLLEGRFVLGVGTGEALNEHIFGDAWPSADVRIEMLEEAVEVMRELWKGEFTYHRGKHYTVENARIYTLPAEPPKVYVSAFGPKALEAATRFGDGYISTMPDADMVSQWRDKAGPGKPTQGGYKVCYAADEDSAVKTAHRLWANSGVPGELSQVLPSPKHFEQVSELVTEDMTRESTVCGPDVERHVQQFQEFADAGYDEVYVSQMGPDYEGFFRFYRDEVLPRVRA